MRGHDGAVIRVHPAFAELDAHILAQVVAERPIVLDARSQRAGDRVRTRELNPPTHIRLPRYVRGRRGVVDRDHGVFVFPDTHAHGEGENPEHVYAVRFEGSTLFGEGAEPGFAVHVDLFESYGFAK